MAEFKEGFVGKLEVPAGAKDVQVFDDDLPGFGVRKFASGAASYFVKYNIGTQQRRKTLGRAVKGNLADMRKEASRVLAKARLGTDVVAEAKAAAKPIVTLGSLVPIYLAAREDELRERSHVEVTRYLEKAWKPLHQHAIDGISRRDLVSVIDGMKHRVAADRARVAISGLFSWAIDRGYRDDNPTLNIRARAQNGPRTRVLSEAELIAVWNACLADDFGRIVRLLILTGQRKAEIGELCWSEIDLDKQQIDLSDTRTKNWRPHVIPLSEQALAIIKSVPRGESRDLIFGRRGTHGYTNWTVSKHELDSRIATARKVAGATKEIPHWTLHDLRRTFVTQISELGFAQPHVVEAIVNHVSGAKAGVAGVYNKAVYLDERREALRAWGAHVAALVTDRKSKVPLRGAQKVGTRKARQSRPDARNGTPA